jgi:hypothetical protein
MMKIVNRQEFLSSPGGTVYSKYHEGGCVFDFCIKTSKANELDNDWYYVDLIGYPDNLDIFDYIDDSIRNQVELDREFELNHDVVQRDGMFDSDDYFMIFDRKDLNKILNKLLRTVDYE